MHREVAVSSKGEPSGADRHAHESLSLGCSPVRNRIQLVLWTAAGLGVGAIAVTVGTPVGAVAGVMLGVVAAVTTQRIQLAWFASNIARSNGADWIDRVPVSLGALRRPLRAIERQIASRAIALQEAAVRDQLREVTLDALEMEREVLDRALGDSRQDMAEVLAALDRALASSAPLAVLRRELVELRELVRLNVYAELPSEVLQLGDVFAQVVAGGVPRGRVKVTGTLPSIDAPAPLIEAMVRSLLGHALGAGEHAVIVKGILDGAMIVVELVGRLRPEPTIHLTMAERACSILGGDLIEKSDRVVAIVPARFLPNLRAVTPDTGDWDFPEAI